MLIAATVPHSSRKCCNWGNEFQQVIGARKLALIEETGQFLKNSNELKKIFIDSIENLFAKPDPIFIHGLMDNQRVLYEKRNLRLALKTKLCEEGNIVIDYIEHSNTVIHEEKKEVDEIVVRREAEKKFNSPDIEIERAEILNQSEQKYDIKCSIYKAFLKRDLPGIEESESWNTELFYVLNRQSRFLRKYVKINQLKNDELQASLSLLRNKNKILDLNIHQNDVWNNNKIRAFKELGLLEYIKADKISTAKDSEHLSAYHIVEKYYK